MTENEAPRPDQQPPPPQAPAPEAQAPQPPAQPQLPEPAPTDLRRNIWLLIIIVGVVVVAWAYSLLTRPPKAAVPTTPSAASELVEPGTSSAAAPALPTNTAAIAQPSAQPEAAASAAGAGQAAGASSGAEAVIPMAVLGSDRLYLLAAPAQRTGQDATSIRVPRLFDVTQRAKAFDRRLMVHLPNRWAGQRPTLALAGRAEESFQPATTLSALQADDRVIVVSVGTEAHVYPVNLMGAVAGATDMVGGRRVFVTWSPVTQLARCLGAKMDDAPVDWEDAGLVYRGNEVIFDAASGSLWDVGTGVALSGPMAEKTAELVPVQMCLWGAWKDAHPTSSVLNPPGANLDKDAGKRIDVYLTSPAVPVPLAQSGPGAGAPPAKDFVLGLSTGGQSRAYDLRTLFAAGQTSLKDTIGTQDFELAITSPRTATATSGGMPVEASVMLWFGWKELHPETTVYSPAPPTPAGGHAAPAPAAK